MYHLLMRVGGYYTPIRNKFVQVQIHVNFLCDLLIVKTPTQPQHNGWVLHNKLNVSNISAVTDPILMKL